MDRGNVCGLGLISSGERGACRPWRPTPGPTGRVEPPRLPLRCRASGAWRRRLDERTTRVVTWAARLVGTRDALLWLVEDGRRLVVRQGTGRFAGCAGRWLGKGEGLAGEAWRTGTPQGGGQGEWRRRCACRWSPTGRWSGCWAWPGASRAGWSARPRSSSCASCAELAGVAIDRAGRLATKGRPAEAGSGPRLVPRADERYRALSEQIPAVLYSRCTRPTARSSTRARRTSGCSATPTTRPCSTTSGRR